jgi:hypothetical protein
VNQGGRSAGWQRSAIARALVVALLAGETVGKTSDLRTVRIEGARKHWRSGASATARQQSFSEQLAGHAASLECW